MKAFKMKNRPAFELVKQNDAIANDYLQMPRWLFSADNPLSLEATVAYALLYNRMLLSKSQGWVNDQNEVFLIFTREELADTLKIGYRKATAVFRELAAAELIWEKRSGRGFPNQIYIAVRQAVQCADQEMPFKNEQIDRSRTAEPAVQEPQKQPSSYIDKNKQENLYSEKSPSVAAVGPVDDDILSILEQSETDSLPAQVVPVFNAAISRLYYAKSYDSDAGRLTGTEIRRHLQNLNSVVLEDVYKKVDMHRDGIHRNPLGYLSTAILNAAIVDGGRSNRGNYAHLAGFRGWEQPPGNVLCC